MIESLRGYIIKLECDIKKKDATIRSLLPVTMSLCPKCEKYGISGRETVCMRCMITSLVQKNKELETKNKDMKQSLSDLAEDACDKCEGFQCASCWVMDYYKKIENKD